jgi:hypothetical protein
VAFIDDFENRVRGKGTVVLSRQLREIGWAFFQRAREHAVALR